MKKIRYQNLIKAVLFTVLTVVMLGGILKITNYKTTGGGGGWQHLYDMDKNSIDVIAFGSSHAHCTVNHGYLWD